MSKNMFFGFIGDFLTFIGGALLAIDAVLEERKLKELRGWMETIEDPALAQVVLTRNHVQLKTSEDVQLSFVRQSAKRAKFGMLLLIIGFCFLVFARVSELRQQDTKADPHSLTGAQKTSDNRNVGYSGGRPHERDVSIKNCGETTNNHPATHDQCADAR